MGATAAHGVSAPTGAEMADNPGTRRLQAIMFTDIAGFSAMMGADEQATVALVLEHRELVRAAVAAHDGVEHETIGDAFLVLFDSPVNATRCAIDIQRQLASRNEGRPTHEQVWLRIGLHLSDILHRDGGIYGDGVNAAARIQGVAEPGCVVISEQLRIHIAGKVDVKLQNLGVHALKGIAEPPPLHKLLLDTDRGAQGTEKLARSNQVGKRLVLAAALLVVAVGAALAINGGASKAEEAHKAEKAAAQRVQLEEALRQAASDAAAQQAAEKAAVQVAAAAAAAQRAQAQVEAMGEVMQKAVGDKVRQAMASRGEAKVKLLEEALALDPDNAATASLLTQARTEALQQAREAEAARERAARAATARAEAAGAAAAPEPAAKPAPAIRPRVIED